jgi:hypothetical protein
MTPSTKRRFDILRRHFVAIATTRYDSHLHDLPGVVDEVATMSGWACADGLDEARRFTPWHPELADNPTRDQLRQALGSSGWNADDAAVVFVTGHGVDQHDTHWLILKESEPAKLHTTAVRTAELLGTLAETDVQHVMVILDLCFAGKVAADVVRFAETLPNTWLVLAAVSKTTKATTRALTTAIAGFLEELGRPEGEQFDHGPYLRVDQFISAIQERLGDRQWPAIINDPDMGESPCLPNPRWTPEQAPSVEGRRADLALRPEDLEAHWGPRARGVTEHNDPGWLFTGRADLMRRLIAAATGPAGTVVLTGCAGSGKSAALARLVTLSDPTFCERYAAEVALIDDELRPPVGAVDVALLATGKLPEQLLAQLSDALGVPGPATANPSLEDRLTAWREWLTTRDKPVTIVLDALDESSDPHGLLTTVLARLSEGLPRPLVRLLVGVRSPGGPDEPASTAVQARLPGGRPLADLAEQTLNADRIRVDEPPWWHQSDVADYAASILRHTDPSPYTTPLSPDGPNSSDSPDGPDGSAGLAAGQDLAGEVGKALAKHTGTSFLVARIAATSLAARPAVIDPTDERWLDAVRDGVLGVFRDDLHNRLDNDEDRLRAVHLLRAVAFGRGRGLPWRDIWPRVANAVADGHGYYGDRDIAWLLASPLGGYLVTDHEDGLTVYRLFHDAFRTTLREQWQELLTPPADR